MYPLQSSYTVPPSSVMAICSQFPAARGCLSQALVFVKALPVSVLFCYNLPQMERKEKEVIHISWSVGLTEERPEVNGE